MYSHRLLENSVSFFVFKIRGPGSITSQSMRDSWWTTWQWDRFCLEYFCFTLFISFPHSSILNFSYVLLLTE